MAEQFTKGGQEGWFHDRGHWGGFFHTYDRFQGNFCGIQFFDRQQ